MMILLRLWLILSLAAAAPLNPNVDKEGREEDLVTDDIASVDIVNSDGVDSEELHNHTVQNNSREAKHVFYGGSINFSGNITSTGTHARINIGSISSNALPQEPHNEPEPQAIDGGWTSFGECTTTCKGGVKTRTCTDPHPQHGGKPCSGDDSQPCNEDVTCTETAIDGGWTSFGECTKTCDGGVQTRTCTDPPPQHGGKSCFGDDSQQCNEDVTCTETACESDEKISGSACMCGGARCDVGGICTGGSTCTPAECVADQKISGSPCMCGDGNCEEGSTCVEGETCTPGCKAEEFSCKSGQCIDADYECDDGDDCDDGSDESDCEKPDCNAKQFSCLSGECIHLEFQCDTKKDCEDGSDEKDCPVCPADVAVTKHCSCAGKGCAIGSTCVSGSTCTAACESDEKISGSACMCAGARCDVGGICTGGSTCTPAEKRRKRSTQTVNVSGKIVLPANLDFTFPTNSRVYVSCDDISNQQSTNLGIAVIDVSNKPSEEDIRYVLEADLPNSKRVNMAATINVGWNRDTSSEEWIRKGDFLNDVSHSLDVVEDTAVYEKDISVVLYNY